MLFHPHVQCFLYMSGKGLLREQHLHSHISVFINPIKTGLVCSGEISLLCSTCVAAGMHEIINQKH